MSATTSNFIDGGEINPFGSPTGKPLTLAEQAAMEDARRRRELQDSARKTAAVNNRPDGYNISRGQDSQDSVDASNKRVKDDRIARTGTDRPTRMGFFEALSKDPVTMGILAGPALVTGGGAIAGGLGFGAGTGTIAAGSSAAPAITTAGGVIPATIAPPVAAGTTAGATTTAAATVPAAEAAFDVGAMLKEAAPIVAGVAPMAYDAIAGGNTKEQDALIAKQKQLAKEAKDRMAQVQESRMNALGQQLLAMNPRNKMMAQMFGPGAAFQPQEFAAMTQNPMPAPEMPAELKALMGKTTKNTPEQDAAFAAFAQQKLQYEQGNQQRNDQMMNGMAPPGPGPAPLQQRTPQAARKY